MGPYKRTTASPARKAAAIESLGAQKPNPFLRPFGKLRVNGLPDAPYRNGLTAIAAPTTSPTRLYSPMTSPPATSENVMMLSP